MTLKLAVTPFLMALAIGALPAQTPPRPFDVVIANGRVIDPESNTDSVRDIGIRAGKIAAISRGRLSGRQVIDASHLVVAPGFIDLHSHAQTEETYRYQALDGVTTALELEVGTADIDRWYRDRERGEPINYGVSIGHIPVRIAVFHDPGTMFPTSDGAHRPASPAQVDEIVGRLEQGVTRGAVSIGAGFPYTPAATREELLDVFRVAARRHVPIHVHIRGSLAGLDEAIGLAADAKAALHVVHINSAGTTDTPEMLRRIAAARARGLDVTTEAYPYTAGMTEIQSANLDAYQDGPDDRLTQLEWPRTGERLTRESFQRYRQAGGPVVIHSNTEEMVKAAIDSPLTMIASDAYWERGTGHPRTTGTFARVLGRYVRDAGSLSLMEAIRKMTLMPATRLQARVPSMRGKGRVRVGADADIVAFDPERVIDRSTYREPALPPTGIPYVLVNGTPVVMNGRIVADAAPGRAVQAPRRRPGMSLADEGAVR